MSSYIGFNYENNLSLLTSHHDGKNRDLIIKAFNYAREKHSGQFRNSGEPYDQHPIKVALKLNEMKADYETICAALLHDVIEDCDVTKEDITREFSLTIANLVDGVTKVSKDIQTINKLILSIEDDVRIIIIKLMDRLHNMETIQGHNSEEKRKRIAKQTLDVYVPIATLFGLYRIKEQLEDLCFKTIDIDAYNEVKHLKTVVLENNSELSKTLYNLQYPYSDSSLYKILSKENLDVFDIRLKYKGLYGIYRNLVENKATDITQITDLITYRVTLQGENVPPLYLAMGLVNDKFPMLNGTQYACRDYISFPKNELYKALLTYNILYTEKEKVQIHFQYQTPKMLDLSILGIASLWRYDDLNAVKEMQDFVENMPVYSYLSDLSNDYKNNIYTYDEFFNKINKLIFSKRIYIKLPNFDFKQTYEGITLEDFVMFNNDGLFDLNKDYYVNGKKQKRKYILHNNDYVESISKEEKDIIKNVFGGIARSRKK